MRAVKRSLKKWEEIRCIINYPDQENDNNTPLLLAAKKWNQDAMLELMKFGANIALANALQERPMQYLKSDTFQRFLDEFCIRQANRDHDLEFPCHVLDYHEYKKVDKDRLEVPNVIVNFSFMAPPLIRKQAQKSPSDVIEGYQDEEENFRYRYNYQQSEMETLQQMCVDPEQRYAKFLSHPVIKLFLLKKWEKVTGFHNCEIRMHLQFAFCFTWYILETFTFCNDNNECGCRIQSHEAKYRVLIIMYHLESR